MLPAAARCETGRACYNLHVTWTPRPRPEWLDELNALGARLGDPGAIVPLDASSLESAARDVTGLHDFGGDDWREPFGVFLDALEREGRLHLGGRVIARTEILRALVNRLRIEATVRAEGSLSQPRIHARRR